jgi:2OG-Fe(II) oxygenase superfamily
MCSVITKSLVASLILCRGSNGLSIPKTVSRNFVLCAKKSSTSSAKKSSAKLSTLSPAEENMLLVQDAAQRHVPEIVKCLSGKGWAIVDGFLGKDICKMYRQEAAGYFERNEMTISKSTRWDAETNSIVTYDKHNVYATQLVGGDMYYKGPRLHEYVVSMVKTLVPAVSDAFPEACLSTTMASNKLAVCTGDGSYYDKHYDNSGADDLRKLTVLYYMNPDWRTELGGCFRIYKKAIHAGDEDSWRQDGAIVERRGDDVTIDVEPRGDRLLAFWSDQLVHSVQPSQVTPSIFFFFY